MKNKVAIAIPTYNRQEYLDECLLSISKQTFQNFNVYIFDNGSNYDTEIFKIKFPRLNIFIYKYDKNYGSTKNFYRIYSHKYTEDYLILFHDDDIMHPTLIQKEVEYLDNNNVCFVSTNMNSIIDSKKLQMPDLFSMKINQHIKFDQTNFVRNILKGMNLCFPTVMYRTKILKNINIKDDEFHKWWDRPFLIKLLDNGNSAGFIYEKLINYRLHQGQDSQSEAKKNINQLINLYYLYKKYLPAPLNDQDEKLYYSYCTNNLILNGLIFSDNIYEYLEFINKVINVGLFKKIYINMRGVVYFFIVIKTFTIKICQKIYNTFFKI